MASRSRQRIPGVMQGISLSLPITLSVMAALFVAPIAPKMAEHFIGQLHQPASYVAMMIGPIITIPSLMVALFSPLAGAIGDRIGRRRMLVSATAVYALVGILPFFLDSLPAILASRIGVGLVDAALMTASTTLIGDYFTGAARDRWLSGQTAIATTSAIGIIYVAGIVGQADWHNVFLLYLCALLFLALIARFTWEPEASSHLSEAGHHVPWRALPWRFLGAVCLLTLFGSVMFYTVQIKLPDALNEIGVVLPGGSYDAARGSRLTALASIFVPLGTVCFWGLAPRTAPQTQFGIGFGLMGLGFLVMAHVATPLAFALAAGLNQVGAGIILPALLTWAVRGLSFETRGRGTGLWTATFALGEFVCNTVAMPAITAWTGGRILPAFAVMGVLCLAAAGTATAVALLRGAALRRVPVVAR